MGRFLILLLWILVDGEVDGGVRQKREEFWRRNLEIGRSRFDLPNTSPSQLGANRRNGNSSQTEQITVVSESVDLPTGNLPPAPSIQSLFNPLNYGRMEKSEGNPFYPTLPSIPQQIAIDGMNLQLTQPSPSSSFWMAGASPSSYGMSRGIGNPTESFLGGIGSFTSKPAEINWGRGLGASEYALPPSSLPAATPFIPSSSSLFSNSDSQIPAIGRNDIISGLGSYLPQPQPSSVLNVGESGLGGVFAQTISPSRAFSLSLPSFQLSSLLTQPSGDPFYDGGKLKERKLCRDRVNGQLRFESTANDQSSLAQFSIGNARTGSQLSTLSNGQPPFLTNYPSSFGSN